MILPDKIWTTVVLFLSVVQIVICRSWHIDGQEYGAQLSSLETDKHGHVRASKFTNLNDAASGKRSTRCSTKHPITLKPADDLSSGEVKAHENTQKKNGSTNSVEILHTSTHTSLTKETKNSFKPPMTIDPDHFIDDV